MLSLIGLALLNGVLIATSRVINAHLGRKVGAIRTSLWNHAVGFVFLSLFIATMFKNDITVSSTVPLTAWLGGALGVAFVALNTRAVPALGASKTTSLVVGAQMVASVVIDSLSRPVAEAAIASLGGAAVIIIGVCMATFVSKN